jgi:hypothetical protein
MTAEGVRKHLGLLKLSEPVGASSYWPPAEAAEDWKCSGAGL